MSLARLAVCSYLTVTATFFHSPARGVSRTHGSYMYFKRAVNEAGYLVQNPQLEKVAQDSRKHDWPSPHPTQGLHCD